MNFLTDESADYCSDNDEHRRRHRNLSRDQLTDKSAGSIHHSDEETAAYGDANRNS